MTTERAGPTRSSTRRTALTTLAVVTVLFVGKVFAALASDAIGVFSTMVDSGLDLLVSLVVLVGVVLAARPADRDHPYGHGKFENVTGLLEAAVLAATGVLIGFFAIERILDPASVTLNAWIVGVLVVAMIVDAERALHLRRAAREHRSPALRVDAWHFAADLVTTGLSLAGLWLAHEGFGWADGAAALAVAAVLVVGSVHVAWIAVGGLVDRVHPELMARVKGAIAAVEHVEGAPQVRLRGSGPDLFVDATVQVPRAMGLEAAHEVMDDVEEAVRQVIGEADVVVHAEPVAARESVATTLKILSSRNPDVLGIHEIFVDEIDDGLVVDCHVEVDEQLSLEAAHAIAQRFEEDVKSAIPGVRGVRTHVEPMPTDHRVGEDVTADHPELIARIERGVRQPPFTGRCDVVIKRIGDQREAIVTATMVRDITLARAHEAAGALERSILARAPVLARVVVHMEPDDA